ncbi:MAG: hypothetical protein IKD90_11260 [Clostridiales bacterium]|nr:hypothetical protein [Clostridiales bacterium]
MLINGLFPGVLLVMSGINHDDRILRKAEQAAIPELLRFRIIEPDVRHDVWDDEYSMDLSQQ